MNGIEGSSMMCSASEMNEPLPMPVWAPISTD